MLGPLSLFGDDGQQIVVPRGRAATVLAFLTARRGQPARRDLLVDVLWGERPPRTNAASVHNYVSTVRALLNRATESGADRLLLTPQGYRLVLHPSECDLLEFEGLVSAGRDAARRGEPARAARQLRRALDLWRGEPFPQLASSPRSWSEPRRLHELRQSVHEDCLEAELSLRRPAELVPELRQLVEDEPLSERVRALLMRALVLAGETASALAVFQEARETLVNALGIEPGRELRELHGSILRDDMPRTPPPPGGDAEGTTADPGSDETGPDPCETDPWTPPRQLPRDLPDFVGRDEVLAQILAHAASTRSVPVLVVTGGPGTGKTALAVHAAHHLVPRFPDGQLYLNLGGGSEHPVTPEDALAALLRNLGVTDACVPTGLEHRAAAYRSRLAGRRVLVVLDDAADVDQITPLLPGTAGSAVLVTGRRRLPALPSDLSTVLEPFTPEESLRFLARLLGAQRVEDEPEAAARLVELCGGLPLGIRIMLSRLETRRHWSLASLVGRMRDERRVLDGFDAGHLSVRASFTLSYSGLGEAERALFRRFPLTPARELACWALAALAGTRNPDEAIDHLLLAHLVEPADGPYERYRVHDLVRSFAAERGAEADGLVGESTSEARAAVRRLFDTAHALIGAAHRRLPTPGGWPTPCGSPPASPPPVPVPPGLAEDAMSWLTEEAPTLVPTLVQGCELGWAASSLDAVERLAPFLAFRHRTDETRRLYRAVASGLADDRRLLARAHFGLAQSEVMAGRLDSASMLLDESAWLLADAGDHDALAHTLVLASFCRTHHQEFDVAERLAKRALRVAETTRDRHALVRSLRQWGNVRLKRGDDRTAVHLLDHALTLVEGHDEPDLEAMVLNTLANALIGLGELDRADHLCDRAVSLLDVLGQPVGRAYVRVAQVVIRAERGDHLESLAIAQDLLTTFRQFGDQRGEAYVRHRMALAELALGRSARAVPLLRAASSLYQALHMPTKAHEVRSTLDSLMPR
ncbi:AfsR/SARP family transcriptional regulator [Actinoalloteichus caeruleus]|uniref:AfsR/SARP family transcriptional regulator n=1 Tax=Actinoalloteichus cyanogriseus TaxID=2893586 RepID=UPI0006917834|nr:BTAD domain-containing putative transcriptional regulator [Actinoalloteichus caeruleus]